MNIYKTSIVLSIIALVLSSSAIVFILQNNEPEPNFSVYDVNLDGHIDDADISLIRENIGTENLQYDVNQDNKVNILDLIIVRNNLD